MRRVIIAALFVISLISMLCIGFVMGAVFTPVMGHTINLVERIFNRNRADFEIQPRVFINPDERQFELQQPGALIVEVISGSPADQAGLRSGERIISFDGESVKNGAALARILNNYQPGDMVVIEVMQRNGRIREISIELGENPERDGMTWLGIRYGAGMQLPSEGIMPEMPEDLEPQLPVLPPDEFSVPPLLEHPGALIREVLPGSPAAEAGLEPGQIILAVDDEQISASNSLADVIATYAPGDTITLTVYASGSVSGDPSEVILTLGENPDIDDAAWLGVRFIFIDIDLQEDNRPEG